MPRSRDTRGQEITHRDPGAASHGAGGMPGYFVPPYWGMTVPSPFDFLFGDNAPAQSSSSHPNDITVSPMRNSLFNFRRPEDLSKELICPQLDVYDLPDSYVVVTSIAGADPKDVDVSYDNSTKQLTVSGHIQNMHKEEDRSRYLKIAERHVGKFERHVLIGRDAKVDEDNIRAKFKAGTLKVIIPKLVEEAPKKKQINVTMESEDDEELKDKN